ncbi:hypothetical protein Ahy_A09g042161 isoform B [Arachis hypogaea]|uniref:Uncharacterized protein n=1 Tax=Arachis hypogaea TaxID=3818 RepID=A0A445BEY1_ARAHY|nr:hypothetical protein Ahy_A09g042161 isoform B [Arachis hypogaea]
MKLCRFGSCEHDFLPLAFSLHSKPLTKQLLPKSKTEVEPGNASFSTTAARTAAVRRAQALPSSSGRPCFFLFQESQLLLPRALRVSPWYSSAPSRSCHRPSRAQAPSSSSGRRMFFQPTTVF